MSKLHDLKNRGYVGLDVSPITNSLIDHAKGETVSIVGTGHNYTNLNGRALRFGAGSSLTVSDNTAQRLDGDGWLVVAGEFNKHGGVAQRYISKRDAGGTNYELYQPSKTEFRVYDGTTESIFTLSSAVDAKVIAVHFSGVGQRPKLYLDGVYSALGSANVTLIGDDALVYLGNVYLGTLVNKNAFTRFIVINDGINVTAQDIAELSQEFIAERGVLHQPRRGYVGTPPKINDASCLLHFDGTKSGSVIPDLTGNGYNATSSTHFSVQSPYGESYGGPRTASIASNTAFLTGSFSFVSWVKIPNITVTSCLFSRDSQPIYIGIDTSENILVSFKDGGSVQRLQTSTTALPIDRWVRMGVSFNVNGSDVTTRFYIDGQFINERVQSTGFFVDPARVVFYGGLTASANLVDGSYTDTAYYNEVKNDAWFASDYGKQATKLAFSHDMKDTPPTTANVTAGQIGETEFTASTGTWKVSEEAVGNQSKKWIENVVAGVAYAKQDKAYGTFVFEAVKASSGTDQTAVGFVNTALDDGFPDAGYGLVLRATGAVDLTKGAASWLFYTANSYISFGTPYKFAVTRDYTGKFTAYIKGGTFTKWTAIVVTWGSNPTGADTTYTSSTYFTLGFKAGDKVRFLGVHEGVLTISDLENLY